MADPAIRTEATATMRGPIEAVIIRHGTEGWQVELRGAIAALVALGLAKSKAPQPGLEAEAICSAKFGCGGSQPT